MTEFMMLKMLNKNKKASVMLTFIAIVFMVGTMIILVAKPDFAMEKDIREANKLPSYIGEMQIRHLVVENDIEEYFFAIDQIARYTLFDSLYELAEKGGYYDAEYSFADKTTGNSYPIWRTASLDHYPTKSGIRKSLASIMADKLDPRFEKLLLRKMPDNNFEFLFESKDGNLKVNAISIVPVDINVKGKQDNIVGQFYLKPSFTVQHPYKIEDFDMTSANAEKIVASCSNKINENLARDCISSMMKDFDSENPALNWSMSRAQDNPNIFLFHVIQENAEMPYHTEKPIIKFALFIPFNPPKKERQAPSQPETPTEPDPEHGYVLV